MPTAMWALAAILPNLIGVGKMKPVLKKKPVLKQVELPDGAKLYVFGGLRKAPERDSDDKPYFTLTGELWGPKSHGRGTYLSVVGAIHGTILEHCPEFADLAALHLADIDGEPMYAVENGVYWAGGTKWQEAAPAALAKHLRVPLSEAEQIIAIAQRTGDVRGTITAAVNNLRTQWKAEADACIKAHGLAVFSD